MDIVDFSMFGPSFPSPPKSYDPAADLNNDGIIDLLDFAAFGGHFLHQC